MKETTICRLCLEPVMNYICVNCLFKDIQLWFSSKNDMELACHIEKKHEQLKQVLSSDTNGIACIKCKENIMEVACPCCYLYEIFLVIKMIRPELLDDFEKIFNFDFDYHHSYTQLTLWQNLHQQTIASRRFQPIVITDKKVKSDINFCDNCEQASDDLKEVNGLWLCETCRSEFE